MFINQIRLIRTIAHVYNQHPSLRELAQLYKHVFFVSCAECTIEDNDIEDQIEPIIGSVVGYSVVGGIPGTGGLSSFMTRSIIDGSVNALVTLRTGIITKRFYSYKPKGSNDEEKRMAGSEAGKILKHVVSDSTGVITKDAAKAVMKSSKTHAGVIRTKIKDSAKKTTGKVADASIISALTVGETSVKAAKTLLGAIRKGFSKKTE